MFHTLRQKPAVPYRSFEIARLCDTAGRAADQTCSIRQMLPHWRTIVTGSAGLPAGAVGHQKALCDWTFKSARAPQSRHVPEFRTAESSTKTEHGDPVQHPSGLESPAHCCKCSDRALRKERAEDLPPSSPSGSSGEGGPRARGSPARPLRRVQRIRRNGLSGQLLSCLSKCGSRFGTILAGHSLGLYLEPEVRELRTYCPRRR